MKVKSNKRTLPEWMAHRAHLSDELGDTSEVFLAMRTLPGKSTPTARSILKKDGTATESRQEPFKRWRQHFNDVFSDLNVADARAGRACDPHAIRVRRKREWPKNTRWPDRSKLFPARKGWTASPLRSRKLADSSCLLLYLQVASGRKQCGSARMPTLAAGAVVDRLHILSRLL